jgi:hypothetical protein
MHVQLTEHDDAQYTQYRAVSSTAIVGLLLGLASPLAFASPLIWPLPLVGFLVSALALRRIARPEHPLLGRKAALAGLAISGLLLAAAPGEWLTYRWLLAREARQFADRWFQMLADGQPQRAYQLVLDPMARCTADDELWDFYRKNLRHREDLESYVKRPLIRTLLALGKRAQIRFYRMQGQQPEYENEAVDLQYAVTYDAQDGQKSFFVNLHLWRSRLKTGRAEWRMYSADGGVRPE